MQEIESNADRYLKIVQLQFPVSINILHDYINEKSQALRFYDSEYVRSMSVTTEYQPDAPQKMLDNMKNLLKKLTGIYDGCREFFDQLKITFVYDFFRQIYDLMKEGYEFVANSFSSSLNKQVETVKAKAVEHFNFGRRDGRVANKFYAKDLLGLEFALNSFANQETRRYQQQHSEFQKLLMQKGIIERIAPSAAVKEIRQIKELIDGVMENTQNIFNQAYNLSYEDIRNERSKFQQPDELNKMFLDQMQHNMKEKFKSGMLRIIGNLLHNKRLVSLNEQMIASTQTEDYDLSIWKIKEYQKVQNLLIIERKRNEKLSLSLQESRQTIAVLEAARDKAFEKVEHEEQNKLIQRQKHVHLQKEFAALQADFHRVNYRMYELSSSRKVLPDTQKNNIDNQQSCTQTDEFLMHKSNKDECLQVDLDVEDIQSQTYSYHMDGDIDYRDGGVTRRLYENNTTSRRWHQNNRFSEAIDNVQRKSVKKHGKVSSRQMDQYWQEKMKIERQSKHEIDTPSIESKASSINAARKLRSQKEIKQYLLKLSKQRNSRLQTQFIESDSKDDKLLINTTKLSEFSVNRPANIRVSKMSSSKKFLKLYNTIASKRKQSSMFM